MLFRSSTVPAAVVIVVKYRACLPVGWLIVGVQARLFGRWVAGVQARQLSDSGNSTVLAAGSFRWQYNAKNGVVFQRAILIWLGV